MAPQLWLLRHGEAVPHESKPDAEWKSDTSSVTNGTSAESNPDWGSKSIAKPDSDAESKRFAESLADPTRADSS